MFAILFIHLIIYKTQKLYWFDSSYLQQMHNLTFQTGKKQKAQQTGRNTRSLHATTLKNR